MTQFYRRVLGSICVIIAMAAAPAHAEPLTFDCDARPNASASVSNLAQTTPSVGGTITAKKLRQGRILPVAGASIASPDNRNVVGFQLKPQSVDATEFDVLLLSNMSGQRESLKVGTVPVNAPVNFRIFLNDQGTVTLFINNSSWSAPFVQLVGGNETAFCSTGQFAFSNLRFSD